MSERNATKGAWLAEKYSLDYYFFFDVSDEISLGKIESLFREKKISAEEFPYRRATPPYIKYAVPPLSIKLGTRKIEANGKAIDFGFRTKIFDFGVISLKASAEMETSLEELNKTSAGLFTQAALEKKAIAMLEELLKKIGPALASPHNPTEFIEKYIAFHSIVESTFDSKKFAEENKNQIAKLLSLETQELSEQQLNANLENSISYYKNDLAIIDFNSTFILDSHEPKDILDVIELARIQLLELCYFDSLLDKELEKIYEELETIKEKNYGKILRKTATLKMSVNELIEKTENAMKLFGETYLVKAFNLAIKEFNVQQWKNSVKGKISTVEDVYNKINDRQQERTNFRLTVTLVILEILFVALWIYELFFRH